MKVLYGAWQDPKDRRWYPGGRLSFDGSAYQFVYTKGAKKSPHFMPFGQMLDLHRRYQSPELFPLFANRLLTKTRPEYPEFLQWLNLQPHEAEPLVVLARTEGKRATDALGVFPCPEKEPDGTYRVHFFSHGVRYLPEPVILSIDCLCPDTPLLLMPDPQNPHDAHAVALRTSAPAMLVGYCPRYLSGDFLHLLQTHPALVNIVVERVNPDSPLQLRLLCSLTAPWPEDFSPCAAEEYEALA